MTVATKLWTDGLAGDTVRESTRTSFDRLGVDRVDLLYVHRPRGDYEPTETLPALADARDHGYPVVAYAPLAGGRVLDDPVIREIAAVNDTGPAAVALAWVLDHDGVVAIPRATSPAHRRANLAAADLSLTSAERRQIDEIDREEELFPE